MQRPCGECVGGQGLNYQACWASSEASALSVSAMGSHQRAGRMDMS